MTQVWTEWEGQVVNGSLPLRRFLGDSDHSAVFLTESAAHRLPNAAIKLVPAESALEAQLSHWRIAAALAHPHLVRLFDFGRCQLRGMQFLFVVMEYAEQSLAQILPHRALTPDEVRDMLVPTLDALSFLHGRSLVQGSLTPTNLLVVNDQLKLASDTIRPAGEFPATLAKSSLYDPPEAKSGRMSISGDMWGLGITLVEALARHPPAWPDEHSDAVSLPATFPPDFAGIVRRCLSRNPANRPAVGDFEARMNPVPQAPAPQAPAVAVPQSGVHEPPEIAAPLHDEPTRRLHVPAIAVCVVILLAAWAGWRFFHGHSNSRQTASTAQTLTRQVAPPPEAAPPPEPAVPRPEHSRPLATASSSVVHEEVPAVPRRARETIQGRVKIAVRVTVDGSGNVVRESLETPGASKYFAHLATDAARKWKFAPADQSSRERLLRFEFTRGGTTAHLAKLVN